MLRGLLIALLLAAGILLLGLWEAKQRWQEPLVISDKGYPLTIAAGQSLRGLAQQLQEEGIYDSPWLLRLYGRWSGLDQQIKRGEYLVPPGTTAAELLLLLKQGKVISYQVTLPEGITLARAIEILASDGRLVQLLAGEDDPRLAEFSAGRINGEGLFFPDSYQFERGASDLDILQRAYDAMQQLLEEEWQNRAGNLPYASSYEALVMASIVERETGVPEERGEIAGVFVRRLQKGMRLQTDPTVIYGIGPDFNGNLTRRDLRTDTPYNTYTRNGLPPTPIAMPGRAAIHAALHPAPGKELYFVATGLGDGSHAFSETKAQHDDAVAEYLRRLRQQRNR